jgi:two-component system, NarL family, response regulator NreC
MQMLGIMRSAKAGGHMSSICCEVARLILADDHAILRDGLRAILTEEQGFDVVGEASDGRQAVKLCETLAPDVAVLDVSMPLLTGLGAAAQILKSVPSTKILMLTMHQESKYVLESLRIGVSGFVVKSKAASVLVEGIKTVLRGEVYLCPTTAAVVANAYLASDGSAANPLSGRELEVLQLIAEGKNVKEIGSILGISAKTAESHRGNIMHKLNVHDVAGLVRYAIRDGLVALGY